MIHDTAQRLQVVRRLMAEAKIDYYYVPSADPYQNEYVPEHWQRRRWISGLSGSAGDVIVGLKEAWLWTDSRYLLQADQEVDKNSYHVIPALQSSSTAIYEWLLEQPTGFTLGIDPQTVKIQQATQFAEICKIKKATLLLTENNLIDQAWENRPPLRTETIRIFEMSYAGQSAQEKIALIQKHLQEKEASALVVNDLASIAWLFNIRGKDIAYNPVVIASAIIFPKKAFFFIGAERLTPPVKAYLAQEGIETHRPENLSATLASLTGTVWVDPQSGNYWIQRQLKQASHLNLEPCPILALKAIKNPVEIAGMREAHITDALALVRFFYWLEKNWKTGITEWSASEYLNQLRLQHPTCLDLSFTTISGFGAQGAIVHYAVNESSRVFINDESLYLIDSGGQYQSGTTDVTRTLHFGKPTAEQKRHYTLVLKGHLALRHMVFPAGTTGAHLDTVARAPLWQDFLDYGHGTGHGVGCYSCVHEFPPRIAPTATGVQLKAGMVVSNEPGVYLTGQYGIRIENVCLVVEKASKAKSLTGHGPFYGFEDLTVVPYCAALIDANLLTASEIKALHDYHTWVYDTLSPLLTDAPEIQEWLKRNMTNILN